MPPSELERFQADYSHIPGFFFPDSAALWDSLLCYQKSSAIVGDFLEIGLYHGKSAALSTLHARPEERCVFVDPYPQQGAPELLEAIRPVEINAMLSSEYRRTNRERETFRWIHIDGDHSGAAIVNDLEIADALLSERGVAVLDDFLNSCWPQITWAAFRWLETHPLKLHLFLAGFNKGYLCRPSVFLEHARYIAESLHGEMEHRGHSCTIWRSLNPLEMNCYGISGRFEDYDFLGPDSERGLY